MGHLSRTYIVLALSIKPWPEETHFFFVGLKPFVYPFFISFHMVYSRFWVLSLDWCTKDSSNFSSYTSVKYLPIPAPVSDLGANWTIYKFIRCKSSSTLFINPQGGSRPVRSLRLPLRYFQFDPIARHLLLFFADRAVPSLSSYYGPPRNLHAVVTGNNKMVFITQYPLFIPVLLFHLHISCQLK